MKKLTPTGIAPTRIIPTGIAVDIGGIGTRRGKDGLSATAFPSGVYGSQVEVTEPIAPLLVRHRQPRSDSAGAGCYRGGLGQIYGVCLKRDGSVATPATRLPRRV
jgi:N-methylhydantoinase B/oxoprolinase/acetone carboxylase alpha subunit